jgi:hypothetical protein
MLRAAVVKVQIISRQHKLQVMAHSYGDVALTSPEKRNTSIITYTHASPSELQAPMIEMFCLQKTLVITNLIPPKWRKLAIK